MTFYVMAPTFERAWEAGVKPLMDNSLSEQEAFGKIVEPFREFMMSQVRDKDLKLFEDLAKDSFKTKDQAKGEIRVLIPAFMISELRRGFEIGFLIALAVSRHRHDRLDADHVDGHDDAASVRDRASDQDSLLHSDRRLEPTDRKPR